MLLKIGCIMVFSFIYSGLFTQVEEINYRGWVRTNGQSADKRIALVIGNSEYMHGAKLKEPALDAQTFALALQSQGYEVELGYNLDRNAFLKAIESFSQKFRKYDSGIVYYAGHGFQIDGENYLIPVDANPESKFQVHSQCINVDHFFRSFNQPDKAKVIILDACRNNPFVQNRSWAAEYRGTTNGMTDVSPLLNSLLIFSTEKNTVVRDDNPFTEIFSKYIREGGCINSILGKISKEVRLINPDQRILPEGLLEEDICFGNNKDTHSSALIDTDGDLIPDQIDKCPNQYGTVENEGCPGAIKATSGDDQDGDGLADELDNCPEERGTIENNGCPDTEYSGVFDKGIFTDDRDNQSYKWVRLKDGKKWMSQNLNFKSNDSWCYNDKKKNCEKYGRLYTWEAAQTACPKGWHMPSEAEWNRIINSYGGERGAYRSMMEGIHDFMPILGGGRQAESDFCCLGDFGNYWTTVSTSARGTYIDFNRSNGSVIADQYSKQWALSCRCVKTQ
ncbi:MAG: FISUMP domain-containing protein [Saprospiraceae bacterium]